MIGTTRPAIRFCCPECGATMRAPRADAGSAIDCPRCGESVRVPRKLHPRESETDGPLVNPTAAANARSGVRLLTISLEVWSVWYVLSLMVLGAWAVTLGPPAVLGREQGWLRPTLLVVGVVEILLVWFGAGLRWVGYGRCRDAAEAVRASGWITTARAGALIAAAGQTFAAWPSLAGMPVAQTPGTLRALGQVAEIARTLGVALEFGILFVWARILTEAGGPGAVTRVRRYLLTAIGSVGGTLVGLCVAATVTVIALHRDRSAPPPPPSTPMARLDYTAIPEEGWYSLATVLGMVSGFAAVLCWQYFQILAATRRALETSSVPAGPGRTPPTGG